MNASTLQAGSPAASQAKQPGSSQLRSLSPALFAIDGDLTFERGWRIIQHVPRIFTAVSL